MILKFYICATAETIFPAPVLSMGRTGKYGAENYRLMEAFQLWLNENGLFDQDTVIYGIPMGAPDKTEPARCRYEVCTPLPGYQVSARGSIQCWTLPGGSFLIFQIPHTAGAVQTAWSLCFSELERLGYALDKSRPVMERYKKRMVDRHRCELCVPVQSPPWHRAGRI